MTDPPRYPSISVVIPVFDGGESLKQCVDALLDSSVPPLEVIVIEDGSGENLDYLSDMPGTQVHYLKSRHGPAFARNAGAELAKGEIILFLDSDVVAPASIIERIGQRFAEIPEASAIFGSYDDDPAAKGFISTYRNLQHHYGHQTTARDATTFWAGCGAVRREAFMAVGGFDQERYSNPSVEDIELGMRMTSAGYRIIVDKTLQVKHLKEWTIGSMIRTDIFRRALPWTELILQKGSLTNDLNTDTTGRTSVVLVFVGIFSLLMARALPWLPLVSLLALGLVVVVNRGFYQFLNRRRGIVFMLGAIPWHLFYYLYSGVAFGLGVLRYVMSRSTHWGTAEHTAHQAKEV